VGLLITIPRQTPSARAAPPRRSLPFHPPCREPVLVLRIRSREMVLSRRRQHLLSYSPCVATGLTHNVAGLLTASHEIHQARAASPEANKVGSLRSIRQSRLSATIVSCLARAARDASPPCYQSAELSRIHDLNRRHGIKEEAPGGTNTRGVIALLWVGWGGRRKRVMLECMPMREPAVSQALNGPRSTCYPKSRS
jgi:hypothetical protein